MNRPAVNSSESPGSTGKMLLSMKMIRQSTAMTGVVRPLSRCCGSSHDGSSDIVLTVLWARITWKTVQGHPESWLRPGQTSVSRPTTDPAARPSSTASSRIQYAGSCAPDVGCRTVTGSGGGGDCGVVGSGDNAVGASAASRAARSRSSESALAPESSPYAEGSSLIALV